MGADLLSDASRTFSRARLTLDLLVKQVSEGEFELPTAYQTLETKRLVKTFTTSMIVRFITAAIDLDPRVTVSVDEVNVSALDPDLVAAALARVDEHWIAEALRKRANGSLDPLMPGEETEEAELSIALLRAVDRRVNPRGEPVLIEEDVGYKTLERLVWRIAAEVRARVEPDSANLDELDDVLTRTAKRIAGPFRRRQPSSAERVADRVLTENASLQPLLVAALNRAQPRLFCALLAGRLKLSSAAVLPALTQPEQLALLLAAAGLSDRETAAIFVILSEPLRLSDDRLLSIVDGYRTLSGQATIEMLRQIKLHPHYRAAIFARERGREALEAPDRT